MNHTEQRIAMAEAMGFLKISQVFSDKSRLVKWSTPLNFFRDPTSALGLTLETHEAWGWQTTQPWASKAPKWKAFGGIVPDFLNDLNAIHTAERSISNPEAYRRHLLEIAGGGFFCASAPQRVEAFLKTKGFWLHP